MWYIIVYSILPTKGLFPVYRLEEDGDLWKKVVSDLRFRR